MEDKTMLDTLLSRLGLRPAKTPIELEWDAITRVEDDCLVLFDSGKARTLGVTLTGLWGETPEGRRIVRMVAVGDRSGKIRTEIFYSADDVLECYFAFDGLEPSWLERKKLGVKAVPIKNRTKLTPTRGKDTSASLAEWAALEERFRTYAACAEK